MKEDNGITVVVVTIDDKGKIADFEEIASGQFGGVNPAFYERIATVQREFTQRYSTMNYTIHAGVAPSLSNFLTSFPEIRHTRAEGAMP